MSHQLWKCPKCEFTYDSPIRIAEAVCPKSKGRGHGIKEVVLMQLVEGEPLPERKAKTRKVGRS